MMRLEYAEPTFVCYNRFMRVVKTPRVYVVP